jgi:hypothetical protein
MDILPEVVENNEEIISENIEDKVEEEPQEEELSEEIGDLIPDPEPKLKIKKEDVFKNVEEDMNIGPVIKKTKKKRQMSEEALKKLAEARKKAHEKRRENAKLRREGKMKTTKQIKEEKILKEKEDMRPVVNNITHKTENITNNITEEDIKRIALETSSKATKEALEGYEAVRKKRKEEKRKVKEEEMKKQKIQNTILKAQGYKLGDDGFFSNCF